MSWLDKNKHKIAVSKHCLYNGIKGAMLSDMKNQWTAAKTELHGIERAVDFEMSCQSSEGNLLFLSVCTIWQDYELI